MSEDDKPRGSWWQTVPGTLTALSGVFTAVAGLLIALNQTGFIGLKGKSPASSITAASTPSSVSLKPSLEAKPSGADPVTATTPSPPLPSATEPDALKPAAKNSAPHYLMTFPSGNEATLKNYASEATFKVLEAEASPKNPGKLSLKFTIRLTNKGRVALSFGSDSFRLQVDGVPRTPVSWLNDMVEGRSAKEADIMFEIPDTTKTLELTVDTGQETGNIPVALKTQLVTRMCLEEVQQRGRLAAGRAQVQIGDENRAVAPAQIVAILFGLIAITAVAAMALKGRDKAMTQCRHSAKQLAHQAWAGLAEKCFR